MADLCQILNRFIACRDQAEFQVHDANPDAQVICYQLIARYGRS